MIYVRLIDYLDKPELIQRVDGEEVRALFHYPEASPDLRIIAVMCDGSTPKYYENGHCCSGDEHSSFILRPQPKKTVKGYRKAVMYHGGVIINPPFYPTKEAFHKYWGDRTLLGDWEEIQYEVPDE